MFQSARKHSRQSVSHLISMNNHVDFPAPAKTLPRWKALWQFLANRLLDNIWPGESCPRVWLSDIDIAQQG